MTVFRREVLLSSLLPNHIHLVLTATRANLSEFKRRFFGEVGKFVKVSLDAHGFESPERVFAEGAGHHERLIGVAAQLTALHYVDVNTVKAGLVERVEHYRGCSPGSPASRRCSPTAPTSSACSTA